MRRSVASISRYGRSRPCLTATGGTLETGTMSPTLLVTVTILAAVARNGVIGVDGGLPWHLPTSSSSSRS